MPFNIQQLMQQLRGSAQQPGLLGQVGRPNPAFMNAQGLGLGGPRNPGDSQSLTGLGGRGRPVAGQPRSLGGRPDQAALAQAMAAQRGRGMTTPFGGPQNAQGLQQFLRGNPRMMQMLSGLGQGLLGRPQRNIRGNRGFRFGGGSGGLRGRRR